MRLITNFLLFSFICISCSLIPKLRTIKSPVPGELPTTGSPGAKSSSEVVKLTWREFYQSEDLKKLIELSLKNNRDYKSAIINVQEVKAQYNIERSNLMPSLNAGASLTRRKIPINALQDGAAVGGGGAPLAGRGQSDGFLQEQYGLEVGITSYELDLFGRIRSLSESALQEYLASDAAKQSVKISLLSEVARTYFKLLADKELEKLAQRTASNQEESIRIIEARFKAGLASELELRQAETLLEEARGSAIEFSRQVLLDRNALQLLVGSPIEDAVLDNSFKEASEAMKGLNVGLSSEVLLVRPDIKRAESLLLAANANIGAARAAFFPSLSLTTSMGKLSTETSNLFQNASNSWLFFPQINLPLFTGGRNKAQLNLAEARKERLIVEYEKAIQNAFREASDALISNQKLFEVLEAQKKVLLAAEKAYLLSRKRYRSGVESYLLELDSQRALFNAERNYINQQLEYFNNLSLLYRTLGGGIN